MLAALLFCLLATAARGQLSQQVVPGSDVVITQTQEVLNVNKRVVTEPSQPVVSTFVQQEVQYRTVPVPVPGAVRTSTVVQQSQQVNPVRGREVVQAYNTVRGADTYHTQIVTVPVKREVINKRDVERVQNQIQQPDTHVTITSVNVVPVTSISYYTRY